MKDMYRMRKRRQSRALRKKSEGRFCCCCCGCGGGGCDGFYVSSGLCRGKKMDLHKPNHHVLNTRLLLNTNFLMVHSVNE